MVLLAVVWMASAWLDVSWIMGNSHVFELGEGRFLLMSLKGVHGARSPGVYFDSHEMSGYTFEWPFSIAKTRSGWYISIPLSAVALPFAIAGAAAWYADTLVRRRSLRNCPKCNYDRTGLAAGTVCPECGGLPS